MSVEVQSHLSEIGPVYERVRQLRERLEELQTVEQARAEYNELFRDEEAEIERWEVLKARLEREAQLLAGGGRKGRSYLKGSERSEEGPPPSPAPTPEPPPPSRRNLTSERRRFQNQASRFRYQWRLDDGTLARINRIADDNDRPLGEAIALLNWGAFENQLRTSSVVYESEAEHAARLDGWKLALEEYVKVLEGDILALENTYGTWMMHVWETWQGRNAAAAGRARWEGLIAQKRQSNAGKLADLQKAVAALAAAGRDGRQDAGREERP